MAGATFKNFWRIIQMTTTKRSYPLALFLDDLRNAITRFEKEGQVPQTFRAYQEPSIDDINPLWVYSWNWVQKCPGLEVYIANRGVELRKFGIRLWAENIIEAVELAHKEGW